MPPKKKAQTDTPKGKELFDFINMIYQDQRLESFDEMTDSEKKKYKNSKYMIHRFLSMNPSYAPIVNTLQKYTNISERAHYMFLSTMLPKGKQFNKYIKGSKDEKYESWLVDLVAKYFSVSSVEATGYLDIYYEQNRGALRLLCEMHGVDLKLIKKAKL